MYPTPERSERWPSEASVLMRSRGRSPRKAKPKLLDFSTFGTPKKPLSGCGFCNNSTFKNMVYFAKSGSSNIFHTYVCSYQGSKFFGFFFFSRGLLKDKTP